MSTVDPPGSLEVALREARGRSLRKPGGARGEERREPRRYLARSSSAKVRPGPADAQ